MLDSEMVRGTPADAAKYQPFFCFWSACCCNGGYGSGSDVRSGIRVCKIQERLSAELNFLLPARSSRFIERYPWGHPIPEYLTFRVKTH